MSLTGILSIQVPVVQDLKKILFSILIRSVESEKCLWAIFANIVTCLWPDLLHSLTSFLTAFGYRFFHSIRKQKGMV